MSEKKQFDANPFDTSTLAKGGGLWDGKTITVISAKATIDHLKYGDGSPVIDSRTGEPSRRNVIEIVGIAEDEEKERRETYSVGRLIPTADGEGFLTPEGTQAPFSEKSEAGKFATALEAAGYDKSVLWDDKAKKTRLSALAGATFRMKGEARLDKDGNIKKNKKGYEEQKFYPVEYLGQKAGGNGHASTTTAPGNGIAIRDKAVDTVTSLLAANNGTLTRTDLIRKLSEALAKDTDCNKVLALVVREEFHKDVPWKRNGTTLVLG